MSFENPTFNTEPNKSEQEPMTPDFLQEQIRLPKDQWSGKFRQLIERKIKENQQGQKEETEESPETLRERTFKRYVNGLGLSEENMRNKRILDLGSGEGEFVKSLIDKGVTPEAYGLDAETDESAVEDKIKDHLLSGKFEEDLPIQNADYVVSVGTVSNGVWGGEEAAKANPLEGLQASQEKWKELLEEIIELS